MSTSTSRFKLRQRAVTRIVIAARPEEVWRVLNDLQAYPRWNPILSVRPWRGDALHEGRRAWLTIKLFGLPLVVPILVEVTATNAELCWVGGPWGLLRGRHSFELRELGDDETELIHAEAFTGLLLPLLWPAMEQQLERLYTDINEALAAHVEGR